MVRQIHFFLDLDFLDTWTSWTPGLPGHLDFLDLDFLDLDFLQKTGKNRKLLLCVEEFTGA
jgi:hypothetical protein